jgi:hypothetical protein
MPIFSVCNLFSFSLSELCFDFVSVLFLCCHICAPLLTCSLFYQFQSIGDDEDTLSFAMEGDDDVRYFRPHAMRNLFLVDEIQAVNPVTDAMVCWRMGWFVSLFVWFVWLFGWFGFFGWFGWFGSFVFLSFVSLVICWLFPIFRLLIFLCNLYPATSVSRARSRTCSRRSHPKSTRSLAVARAVPFASSGTASQSRNAQSGTQQQRRRRG